MEKMEDWWGNLEKLEKLDDELTSRDFGQLIIFEDEDAVSNV